MSYKLGRDFSEEAALRELLARFPTYMENAWVQIDQERGYFGDGGNGEDGIRTNANVAFAAAVIASHPEKFDIGESTGSKMLDRCRSSLNYLTGAHKTGDRHCANGRKWGLEWQSAWWAAKLACAARLIWPELTLRERKSVERLVVAEANRQLTRIVPSGLHLDTKAEENAWDAEILCSALALLPDHKERTAWRDKLIEFSANVFSTPQDRTNTGMLDGRRISDLVYTCNLHGDFSLENHGAYHFCYVASPLLSKAWCAYTLMTSDEPVPEALFHNVEQVWTLAEKTFLTNRFAYIGGQDWARYSYGEYFIIPALTFIDTNLKTQRAVEILQARLNCLLLEARRNPDGSFFGTRFTNGKFGGQYGKYETDCFCCIGLAWLLRQPGPTDPSVRSELSPRAPFNHVSPEGQFCFRRSPDYFFSFSWTTLEDSVPNVSFAPLASDDLCEWNSGNMVGTVGLPFTPVTIGVRAMQCDDRSMRVEGVQLARSRRGRPLVEHFFNLCLDFQHGQLKIRSKYVSRSRLWLATVTGVNLAFPNDIFNNNIRTISFQHGSLELRTDPCKHQTRSQQNLAQRICRRVLRLFGWDGSIVNELKTNWINVDNTLGIILPREDRISIRHFRNRSAPWGSLFLVRVEAPERITRLLVPSGSVLFDTDLVVHLGSKEMTAELAAQLSLSRQTAESLH